MAARRRPGHYGKSAWRKSDFDSSRRDAFGALRGEASPGRDGAVDRRDARSWRTSDAPRRDAADPWRGERTPDDSPVSTAKQRIQDDCWGIAIQSYSWPGQAHELPSKSTLIYPQRRRAESGRGSDDDDIYARDEDMTDVENTPSSARASVGDAMRGATSGTPPSPPALVYLERRCPERDPSNEHAFVSNDEDEDDSPCRGVVTGAEEAPSPVRANDGGLTYGARSGTAG